MELRTISQAEAIAIQSLNLGLRGDPSPWDYLAEAWRASLWALCHPHWSPVTTQKMRRIFTDIAGPALHQLEFGKGDAVLNHLIQVGDLVKLPRGYWLPAPSRIIDWGPGYRPQLIGGVPSWVLEKMQPRWGGTAGFRRTAEDLELPRLPAEGWCDRAQPKSSMKTIEDGIQALIKQPTKSFEPSSHVELSNRALPQGETPGFGTWLVVKDRATHQLIGVAETTPSGWLLRLVPSEIDPPAAALVCQVQAGGKQPWTQSDTLEGVRLHLFRKLPRWHRSALLSHTLRPEISGESIKGYDYLVSCESLKWIEANVFHPLQMRKA